MTDIGDNESSSTLSTITSSILMPVTTDKTALIWDGNDATIKGLLYECGQYYKRKGLFQPLIKHRTVSLSNGKLALEDPNTVYFTTSMANDPRDFANPCPPSIRRITTHNAERYARALGRAPSSRSSRSSQLNSRTPSSSPGTWWRRRTPASSTL